MLQGAGLVLKSYGDASHLLTTMKLINSVCKSIETVSTHDHFWRLCMEVGLFFIKFIYTSYKDNSRVNKIIEFISLSFEKAIFV